MRGKTGRENHDRWRDGEEEHRRGVRWVMEVKKGRLIEREKGRRQGEIKLLWCLWWNGWLGFSGVAAHPALIEKGILGTSNKWEDQSSIKSYLSVQNKSSAPWNVTPVQFDCSVKPSNAHSDFNTTNVILVSHLWVFIFQHNIPVHKAGSTSTDWAKKSSKMKWQNTWLCWSMPSRRRFKKTLWFEL